jgi:hypothetical protein
MSEDGGTLKDDGETSSEDPRLKQLQREADRAALEQKIAEANQATAKAQRDSQAALAPQGESKPLEGKVELGQGAGYLADALAYDGINGLASHIADQVAAELPPGARVLIVENRSLTHADWIFAQLTSDLEAHCKVLTDAEANGDKLLAALQHEAHVQSPPATTSGTASEETSQRAAPGTAVGPESFTTGAAPFGGAPLTALPSILSAMADVAGMFRTNYAMTSRSISLPAVSLVTATAGELRRRRYTGLPAGLHEMHKPLISLAEDHRVKPLGELCQADGADLDPREHSKELTFHAFYLAKDEQGTCQVMPVCRDPETHGHKARDPLEERPEEWPQRGSVVVEGFTLLRDSRLFRDLATAANVRHRVEGQRVALEAAAAADASETKKDGWEAKARAAATTTAALVAAFDRFYEIVTAAPTDGYPPVVGAALRQALRDAPHDLGVSHVLYVGINSSGGEVVTQQRVFGPSGRVAYLAGLSASWLMMDVADNSIVAGGSRSHHRRLLYDLASGKGKTEIFTDAEKVPEGRIEHVQWFVASGLVGSTLAFLYLVRLLVG